MQRTHDSALKIAPLILACRALPVEIHRELVGVILRGLAVEIHRALLVGTRLVWVSAVPLALVVAIHRV
jgi:hypothetical protein